MHTDDNRNLEKKNKKKKKKHVDFFLHCDKVFGKFFPPLRSIKCEWENIEIHHLNNLNDVKTPHKINK